MVHPDQVVHALNQGADGVIILGCNLGECHYLDGNYKALARAELIEELLEDFGFEKERFHITWLSAAEPDKFAEAVQRMHNKISALS